MNCWLDNTDFVKLVSEKWEAFEVNSSACFVLKEKLKYLKNEMKRWNRECFGNIDSSINNIVEDIKVLDDKGERGDITEGDILARRQLFESFWKASRIQKSILFQKARSKWFRYGDSNSTFFHACVKK